MDGKSALEGLFYPQSIAIFGVSNSPQRVGYSVLYSLLRSGYRGKIYPIHPVSGGTVMGCRVYRSLDDIPEGKVQLAIACVNERATVEIVKECGRRGVTNVVCIAGGYRESGEEGGLLEKELKELAKTYKISLVGPNTLGIINNEIDLYAVFHPCRFRKGPVSFISQSGGVGHTLLIQADEAGLGVNKWVGVGNRTVLDFPDYLNYLGSDPGTRAIGIFIEGTEKAGELVRAASQIDKPVVAYKGARTRESDFHALTHTGSMAGSYKVYHDIFRQFGIYPVDSIPEMVASLKALALAPPARGKRVGVVTHSAGPSILIADELLRGGCLLSSFTERTVEKISHGPLGAAVIPKNPLDLTGSGGTGEIFGYYLELVAFDHNVDIVVAIFFPHELWRFPRQEILAAGRRSGKPILVCAPAPAPVWEQERKELEECSIPVFRDPHEAAWGACAMAFRASYFSERVAQ